MLFNKITEISYKTSRTKEKTRRNFFIELSTVLSFYYLIARCILYRTARNIQRVTSSVPSLSSFVFFHLQETENHSLSVYFSLKAYFFLQTSTPSTRSTTYSYLWGSPSLSSSGFCASLGCAASAFTGSLSIWSSASTLVTETFEVGGSLFVVGGPLDFRLAWLCVDELRELVVRLGSDAYLRWSWPSAELGLSIASSGGITGTFRLTRVKKAIFSLQEK